MFLRLAEAFRMMIKLGIKHILWLRGASCKHTHTPHSSLLRWRCIMHFRILSHSNARRSNETEPSPSLFFSAHCEQLPLRPFYAALSGIVSAQFQHSRFPNASAHIRHTHTQFEPKGFERTGTAQLLFSLTEPTVFKRRPHPKTLSHPVCYLF